MLSPVEGTDRQADDAVRVLIADDDPVVRSLLAELIAADASLELVGAAEDSPGAIELAAAERPHVALLDWVMPGGGGPAAARGILALDLEPPVRIVALTAHDSQEASVDMLRAGAQAFVVKGSAAVVETIHAAARD